MIITAFSLGSASILHSSTLAVLNPSAGIIIISISKALLNSIAILTTNEFISKLKILYTKLGDWIKVITLLYEKILKTSMIHRKIDEKETLDFKKIYNQYVDKRKEIMKNTLFRVEDVFGDVLSKDSISEEQTTKLDNFSRSNVNTIFCVKIKLFKPGKKKKRFRTLCSCSFSRI